MTAALRPGRPSARAILGLAVLIGLSGCARLLPQTPDAIFDLSAPSGFAVPSGTNAQILVPTPSALRALDTERIAARPAASEYAYLPGAVWADSLPRLLQARLLQTLQDSGRVRAVALPGQGVLIDYQIILDIRSFEIANGAAVAEFALKLMDDRTGRVVATEIVRQSSPVAGSTNPDYVAALDRAMDEAFVEITRRVLARI
ncbi:ABC-type transport auxiliary lipoprotein family protein [Faunimonas sp. B44]|uniref:ABC-type transport auxiliary lipoprotein family protein n=1 Tax=Faunimonas sp. B44 TaxID=3461493 RepID=UPI00404500F4